MSFTPEVVHERRRRISDPKALRALAHPLRLELLDRLMSFGEQTAAQCAEAVGSTASNCSYHLRALVRVGLVEAGSSSDRRERPWRATSTGLEFGPADPASSPLVTGETLLRDADAAMYRAKADGRARSTLFAHTMRAKAVDRLDTEVSLRHGIEHDELVLHYQPIVELPSRRIVGTEALVRWCHPTRGLVPPDQFIPVAEETGLIVPLGAWVLRQAAAQARTWQRRRGHESMTMAVNLSALQLASADLVDLLGDVLVESGLPPHCLELEITESVLMDDAPAVAEILEGLKTLGVRLSVDDFGTGYSSLSYLKRFPVDTLKIDQSFIAGLSADPNDIAIVTAILSLSTALNLTTVAEGVETALHADALHELGCDRAQGYYFARPAPAADIDALLDG